MLRTTSSRQFLFRTLQRNLHVQSWTMPVAPGGTLKVRLPIKCTVKISPLDPHNHDWNEAKIGLDVLGETDEHFISEETAKAVANETNINITSDYEPGRNFLQVEAPSESAQTAFARAIHRLRAWIGGPFRAQRDLFDSQIILDIGIPGRFDLDIEIYDGSVIVDDTFEGDVKIQTSSADINVNKLKSMYVDLEADDGDISASTIQGNVSIRADKGNVDLGKVQGPSIKLTTDSGYIRTSALYADYAMLRTREGFIQLTGAQGYTKIRTVEGCVDVAGIEGRLDIETDAGDIDAKLSIAQMVSLRSRNGDISLGIPDDLNAQVLLEGGANVEIDDDVRITMSPDVSNPGIIQGYTGVLNNVPQMIDQECASVYARAPNGEVFVRPHSWAGTGFPTFSKREEIGQQTVASP